VWIDAHVETAALLYDRHGILREKVIGFEYTDTIEAQVKPLL